MCFYVATLVVYLVVVLTREEDGLKFIGLTTPVFLIASDCLLLSLREKPLSVDGKSSLKEFKITDLVYSTVFQSFVLLAIRVILCFNKYQWLIMYSAVFLIVQIVASFDLCYAVFPSSQALGNEQEEILSMYKQVPLLQVRVRTQNDELHCDFSK